VLLAEIVVGLELMPLGKLTAATNIRCAAPPSRVTAIFTVCDADWAMRTTGATVAVTFAAACVVDELLPPLLVVPPALVPPAPVPPPAVPPVLPTDLPPAPADDNSQVKDAAQSLPAYFAQPAIANAANQEIAIDSRELRLKLEIMFPLSVPVRPALHRTILAVGIA
jgi:hypothetical protein